MDGLDALKSIGAPARDSLADQVVTILKRYILAEPLEPGSRLPAERHLANTLNVSRTVLREAQSRLLGEGLLERRSPRILQVAEYDAEALAASLLPNDERATSFVGLMEMRYILEIGALPLIAARVTPEALAEIERCADEYERLARAGESAHRMDVQFHVTLLRSLGNPTIDAMLPLIEKQIREFLMFDPGPLRAVRPDPTDRVIREHREIVEALRNRDAAAARDAMERQLAPYFAAMQEHGRENGNDASRGRSG